VGLAARVSGQDKTRHERKRSPQPIWQYGVRPLPAVPQPHLHLPIFHLQWHPMRALQDGTAAWGTSNQPVYPIFSCSGFPACAARPPDESSLADETDLSERRPLPARHLPLATDSTSLKHPFVLYRKVQVTDHPLSQWPPSPFRLYLYIMLLICYYAQVHTCQRADTVETPHRTQPVPTALLPPSPSTPKHNLSNTGPRQTNPTDLFWSSHEIFEKPYP